MTTVVDVSHKLGEYMLKGWVLTDKICQKCSKVPLMRSPTNSALYFCANCDGDPNTSSARPSAIHGDTASEGTSTASTDTTNHQSRPSTPLTEMSSALSSPTFAPPVETIEMLRRRQQSDTASAEIGKRLLKGWAMLADECPSSQCYGIPLVRPPKSGPEKDPRKECVICHNVYVDEVDAFGSQRLVPFQAPQSAGGPATTKLIQSGRSNADRDEAHIQLEVRHDLPSLPSNQFSPQNPRDINPAEQTTFQTLDTTAAALERSMRALTEKLGFFTSGPNVDAVMIGQTADAISKVSQALTHVKQLSWSEKQALGS